MNRLSFHPRFYLSITINVNLCNLILYQASFFHIFNNLNELLIKEVSLVFETSGKILILFFWEQLFAEIKIWIIFAPVLGRLAQLVQSICLTSRGSAVRIRHRPQQGNRSCYSGAGFFVKCIGTTQIKRELPGKILYISPTVPRTTTISGLTYNSLKKIILFCFCFYTEPIA